MEILDAVTDVLGAVGDVWPWIGGAAMGLGGILAGLWISTHPLGVKKDLGKSCTALNGQLGYCSLAYKCKMNKGSINGDCPSEGKCCIST